MILVFAASVAELCLATDTPVLPADPVESATYAVVGDEARANDDMTIAVTAYQKALALDPKNRAAAAALHAICDAAPASDTLLLDAIAAYRRGDRRAARELIDHLRGSDGSVPGGAHLLLGMIALEEHDRTGAERELAAASRDPAYRGISSELRRLARRDGMFATALVSLVELDSNPQQLPDTPPIDAESGPRETDAALVVAHAITARPLRWLAVRNVVGWREQRRFDDLDFLGENAQLALENQRGANRISVRYDFDYDRLGGSSYLLAHRATVAARHDLGNVEISVQGAARHRDYQQAAQSPFTGWVFGGEAGLLVHFGERVDADVRALGWREDTRDPVFSSLAGGGQLALRLRPAPRVRLALGGDAWYARYDAREPDGALRSDTHVDGMADIEVDIADHVLLLAGAGITANFSTVEDFRYSKLVARCGLAFAIGGP